MKKSALLLTVVSAASLLASCGSQKVENQSTFAIGITGNLKSGETCKLNVYKDAQIIDTEVVYTVNLANVSDIEGNLITWKNTQDVDVTITADFTYESSAIVITADVHVEYFNPLEGLTLTSIKELKTNGKKGEKYTIEGTMMLRRGNGSGGYDGFILKDGTDTIYVFDSSIPKSVSEGKKIIITATYDLWMVQDTKEQLEALGYTGARQLTGAELVYTYDGTFDYSFDEFEEATMYDLNTTIPGANNITSNVYKVVAKITKDKPANYINYYFNDPKEIGSMYTYSNHDGKDYAYLDKYCDGKYRECLVMIINAQAKGPSAFYRMVPVAIGKEVSQTNQNIVDGAVIKASESFNSSYYTSSKETTLENLTTLEGHDDVKFAYTSSNTDVARIENNIIHLTGKAGKTTITIKASIGEVSATKTAIIDVIQIPDVKTTSISEIYSTKHLNDEVAIRGIVASYSWKNGAGNKGVYYIADATGSVIIEPNAKNLETELQVGEEVIIKGKYYIEGETEPGEGKYFGGNRCITDAEILFHDNQSHELPIKLEEKTISEIRVLECTPEATKVGNLYMTTCKIEIFDGGFYKNGRLVDLVTGEYTNVYSASIHDIEFLEKFNGKTVKMMVGLRDSKKGDYYRIDAFETAIEEVK